VRIRRAGVWQRTTANIAVSLAKTQAALLRFPANADTLAVQPKRCKRNIQSSTSAFTFCCSGGTMKITVLTTLVLALGLGVACTSKQTDSISYSDGVKKALEQSELTDVSVSEDRDKNTVTLGGTVHSDDAKMKAADIAKASAGNRIVVNEVSVQPVGVESEAKSIASNEDSAIEKNYKAALISSGLDKQDIDFGAKNGVLTLKGSVKTVAQRQEAQQVASSVPNVQQVLNQIDVKH
jgi:osmotically-inducible protein OsmY